MLQYQTHGQRAEAFDVGKVADTLPITQAGKMSAQAKGCVCIGSHRMKHFRNLSTQRHTQPSTPALPLPGPISGVQRRCLEYKMLTNHLGRKARDSTTLGRTAEVRLNCCCTIQDFSNKNGPSSDNTLER